MPFPCAQTWTGTTRDNHSPSRYAVDWNRVDDVDDPVVAARIGTLGTLGSTSNSTGAASGQPTVFRRGTPSAFLVYRAGTDPVVKTMGTATFHRRIATSPTTTAHAVTSMRFGARR